MQDMLDNFCNGIYYRMWPLPGNGGKAISASSSGGRQRGQPLTNCHKGKQDQFFTIGPLPYGNGEPIAEPTLLFVPNLSAHFLWDSDVKAIRQSGSICRTAVHDGRPTRFQATAPISWRNTTQIHENISQQREYSTWPLNISNDLPTLPCYDNLIWTY